MPSGPLGYLVAYPNGQSRPLVSTLNSPTGAVVANAAIVPAAANGAIDIFVTDRTDFIVDINGYFVTQDQGLQIYAVTPCRVMDTRVGMQKTGAFGPPFLAAGSVRVLPIAESNCGVPGDAGGYLLNITVVPRGPLAYLTVWPSNSPRPLVSTLNSFEGRVVANAALVPAGISGAISIFVTDNADVIVDVSGYLAP
ncbi:MAG: hypothetical protein JNK48_01505 [Bryobacterales bacterium]|nr:hypothetical protein [Bryobacterales bacterium]